MPLFGPPNVEKLKEKREISKLIKALEYKDFSVRESVARALGEIGDTNAIGPLCSALADEDAAVVVAARDALVKIGEPSVEVLLDVLKKGDEMANKPSIQALVKIGTPAVEGLLAAAKDTNQLFRRAAIEALVKIEISTMIEPLTEALRDDDKDVRKMVVEVLRQIDDERTVELLQIALEDEDSALRFEAACVLGEFGDIRVIEHLLAALKGNEKKSIQERAARVLAKIGESAVEPLLQILKDKDPRDKEKVEAAKMAEYALGKIGTPSIEPLLSTLEDERFAVRWGAAEALIKIGTPALGALLSLIYKGEKMRQTAKRSLMRISDDYETVAYAVKGLNFKSLHSSSIKAVVARALFYKQKLSGRTCPKCMKGSLVVPNNGDIDNEGCLKLSCVNCFYKAEVKMTRSEFDDLSLNLRQAGFKPMIVDEFDLIHLQYPDLVEPHVNEIQTLIRANSDSRVPGDIVIRMLESQLIAILTVIITVATGIMPDLQYLLEPQKKEDK
jgi:HEAT repeat protein